MAPKLERKLTTILAADVVGYSRLMAADEAGTLAALKAHRRDLIDPKAAEYHGRTVKLVGDGTLMEFGSVVDAVMFAVDVQTEMRRRNRDVPDDRRIDYRVGINVGDIIVDGDDIYGNGVNVAARLEALAEPGGVCVSHTAFSQVKGHVDLSFEDLGEKDAKNLPEPIRVFRAVLEDPSRPTGPAGESMSDHGLPEKPSVAVLPFTNMSGDPEQEYFSDGITEDIITELSHFRSLFVIARNSSFIYKGRAVPIPEVGKGLGVQYVVEGSVRKAGNRVRVTAQLVESISGKHVWAERYDRELEDIFQVQDELTQAIVAAVAGRLEAADLERAKRKATDNAQAYELLLRGKDHHHQFTKEDNAKGLEVLERAIELDPGYAQAHAWLACTYGQAWARGYAEDGSRALKRCWDEAKKAYASDENDSECHRILCALYLMQKNFDQAIHHHERAIALNPNDPLIVSQAGHLRSMLGQAEEGVRWIREAMRLDPYRPDLYGNNLGIALYTAGQYAEAVTAFRRMAALRCPHHAYLAACHGQLGDEEAAKAHVEAVFELEPDFTVDKFLKGVSYREPNDLEHLRQGLMKAGFPG